MSATFSQPHTWWVQPREDGPWKPIANVVAAEAALKGNRREVYPLGCVLMDLNAHPPRGASYLRKNPTLGAMNPPSPWCILVSTGVLYEHQQGPIWFDGTMSNLAKGSRRYLTQAELTAFVVSCVEISESLEKFAPSRIVDARDRDEVRREEEADAAAAKEELGDFLVDSDEEEDEESGSYDDDDEDEGSGDSDVEEVGGGSSSIRSCSPPPKPTKKRRVVADSDSSESEEEDEVQAVEEAEEEEDAPFFFPPIVISEESKYPAWVKAKAKPAPTAQVPAPAPSAEEADMCEAAIEEVVVLVTSDEESCEAQADEVSRDMLLTVFSRAPSPSMTPSEFSSVAADVADAVGHSDGEVPRFDSLSPATSPESCTAAAEAGDTKKKKKKQGLRVLTPPPNLAWINSSLVVAQAEMGEAPQSILTLEDILRVGMRCS